MEITPWLPESHDLVTDNVGFARGLATIERNADIFTYIMPCTSGCAEDGSVVDASKQTGRLKQLADKKHIPLLPLIAGDPKTVDQVIKDKSKRRRHIQQIVNYVKENDFNGIDLDYEFLPGESRYDFTEFAKELANELHQSRRLLAVDLHPKLRPDDPWSSGARAQDWRALSQVVDILHVMCYDQYHYAYTYNEPGPVSTAAWTEAIVVYALSGVVPPDKLVIGLPTYATDYNLSDNSKSCNRFYDQVMALAKRHHAEMKLNEIMNQPYFRYVDEAKSEHEVWFEDVHTLAAKFDVIAKYPMRGLAFWSLTLEDQRIWDELRSRMV